ncbi:MAG: 3-methyl-2-oxobutanoate hydroxymethyltransferase [Candidatus Aureabacteria bacterium]|nr:3-methyl-2-oxobutanoate hydroxymethyltransferase [Candidatus Auribacterota bacterium]
MTIPHILEAKGIRKLVCTTAYTFTLSELVSDVGLDIVLVGDSLGTEIHGYKNTVYVTLDDVIYHSKAVARANQNCFIVGDMPFLSTEVSVEETLKNAGRLILEGGVDAVKIEGGSKKASLISALVEAGIPVMGHLGLHPQKILQMGKYSVQGRQKEDKKRLVQQAKALEKAGIFSLVLECIPSSLARTITQSISIPTIGIGAGKYCDGQILVSTDIFGLRPQFKPKFVKIYADIHSVMKKALNDYKKEVMEEIFPDDEHSYK